MKKKHPTLLDCVCGKMPGYREKKWIDTSYPTEYRTDKKPTIVLANHKCPDCGLENSVEKISPLHYEAYLDVVKSIRRWNEMITKLIGNWSKKREERKMYEELYKSLYEDLRELYGTSESLLSSWPVEIGDLLKKHKDLENKFLKEMAEHYEKEEEGEEDD